MGLQGVAVHGLRQGPDHSVAHLPAIFQVDGLQIVHAYQQQVPLPVVLQQAGQLLAQRAGVERVAHGQILVGKTVVGHPPQHIVRLSVRPQVAFAPAVDPEVAPVPASYPVVDVVRELTSRKQIGKGILEQRRVPGIHQAAPLLQRAVGPAIRRDGKQLCDIVRKRDDPRLIVIKQVAVIRPLAEQVQKPDRDHRFFFRYVCHGPGSLFL